MFSIKTTTRNCFFLLSFLLLAPSISSARFTEIDLERFRFCGLLATGEAECVSSESVADLLADPDQRYTTVQNGDHYSCGITTEGMIDCWGAGPEGQTEPPGFDNPVVTLSVGRSHACAIDNQSNVKCWGQNVHGQTEPPEPANEFVDVEAFGIYGSCGVKQSGEVLCWGRFNTTFFTPNYGISSDSPVTKIHATERRLADSGADADQIRCVTRQDETITCFMNNRGDQLVTELSSGPYKEVEFFQAGSSLSICALTFNSELDCARLVNDDGTTDRLPVAVERPSVSFTTITSSQFPGHLLGMTLDGRLTVLDSSFNIVESVTGAESVMGRDVNEVIVIVNGELDLPAIALDGAEFYGESVGLELFYDIRDTVNIDTQIFRDGVFLETTENRSSYLDTTAEPNTEYSYTIRPVHRFGQLGEFSEPLVISTSAGAPEDAANLPVPGESSRPNRPMGLRAEVYWFDVELFWDRNQSGQVDKYEIRRNGELVGVSRGTSWYDNSTGSGQLYQFDVIALGPNDEFLGIESTSVQIGATECSVD